MVLRGVPRGVPSGVITGELLFDEFPELLLLLLLLRELREDLTLGEGDFVGLSFHSFPSDLMLPDREESAEDVERLDLDERCDEALEDAKNNIECR